MTIKQKVYEIEDAGVASPAEIKAYMQAQAIEVNSVSQVYEVNIEDTYASGVEALRQKGDKPFRQRFNHWHYFEPGQKHPLI